jgi:hypothetical protein
MQLFVQGLLGLCRTEIGRGLKGSNGCLVRLSLVTRFGAALGGAVMRVRWVIQDGAATALRAPAGLLA